MKDSAKLTVADILKSPHFEHALLIAGKTGLGKTVHWVHILETNYVRNYVNGNELVLTTGAGWKDKNDPISFLEQLIDKNVTSLCIQLGEKFNDFESVDDVPLQMIEQADANDFPLIVFPADHDSRFVDLVHSLHSIIINQNYGDYLAQEKFLNDFYLILLNPHDIKDILFFLHRYLDLDVAYYPEQDKPYFAPRVSTSRQRAITALVNEMRQKSVGSMQSGNLSVAYRKVNAYNQDLAQLVIYSDKRQLKNYEYLILEKCALGLAQEHIGNIIVQERERQNRELWVKEWLQGKLSIQTIMQNLQEADPFFQPTGCAACLIQYSMANPQQKKPAEQMLNITGVARSFIEQQGFSLLCSMEPQSLIFILLNKQKEDSWKPRLTSALGQINEVLTSSTHKFFGDGFSLTFSIGKNFQELDQLKASLKTAQESLYIQQKFGKPALLFYDDLHVYRIIMALEKIGSVNSFVMDYLQPIIKDDHKPDGVLLKTLVALRDCHYNKNEAAKKLYVSRQSLYQRIKTLEELLGEDFISSPQKRICLETALYGLEYLSNK